MMQELADRAGSSLDDLELDRDCDQGSSDRDGTEEWEY